MRLDNETLKKRLRYQGQQYGNGQVARGGEREPHMLEQAADRIEELETGIRDCSAALMDSVTTHGTQGGWLHDEAKRLDVLAEVAGRLAALVKCAHEPDERGQCIHCGAQQPETCDPVSIP